MLMEAKEFGEKIKRAVAEVLGEDYQVSLQEVKKIMVWCCRD